MKMQSGYQGKSDPLREKAKGMFKDEFSEKNMKGPMEALQSPGNTKLRRFASGGKCGVPDSYKKGGATTRKAHRLTQDQTDLHLPKKVKSKIPPYISAESASAKKRGGSVKGEEKSFEKAHGKGKKGIGGYILGGAGAPFVRSLGNKGVKNIAGTGVGLGDVLGSMFGTGAGLLPFKKGGKVCEKPVGKVKKKYADGGGVPGIDYVAKKGGHMKKEKAYNAEKKAVQKKHGKDKYLWGGAALGTMAGAAAKPFINKIPLVGKILGAAAPIIGGGLGGFLPFKDGGHAVKRGKGAVMKKAAGGSVAEQRMVGERPSRKAPNFNYEEGMRGQRPVKAAMKTGGQMKMAAGGVGKIRHKQATAFGIPIKPKHSRQRSTKV